MRAPGGPRLLLRRLREVMAEPVTAQARLDRIVVLIASNMVAEVCSLYVARADGPLELLRDRRPQSRGGASDDDDAGRRPRRPDRRHRRAACALRRAEPPRLLLQAGDRRRNLPIVPRRAGAARRRDARRAGGAEPRAAHLFRGGDRGAADDRDAARRNDRLGRIAGDRRPGARRSPSRRPVSLKGAADRRGARPRPRRAAPAARRRLEDRRRRRLDGARPAGEGDRGDARLGRRADRPQRRRPAPASIATCSKRSA